VRVEDQDESSSAISAFTGEYRERAHLMLQKSLELGNEAGEDGADAREQKAENMEDAGKWERLERVEATQQGTGSADAQNVSGNSETGEEKMIQKYRARYVQGYLEGKDSMDVAKDEDDEEVDVGKVFEDAENLSDID